MAPTAVTLRGVFFAVMAVIVTSQEQPPPLPAPPPPPPPPPPPEVRAPSATYVGYTLNSTSGRTFYAFSGIRYGKPPYGMMRFKEAELADNTPDMRIEARTEGPDCLQIDRLETPVEVSGHEDCLFLNVYTPDITADSRMAVMVWIHGGNWKFGSGSARMYGPQPMMDKDVVLVTINYRIGPLGFSSFEDELYPGNLGLKDQRTALLWVRRNIRHFGGDPEKVTLFGQSAGGASVHFHMLSPMSSGLFRSCISESGSALGPWALAQPGQVREKTLELASMLNCSSSSLQYTIECLSSLPAYQLIEAQLKFDLLDQELVLFRPVVEMPNIPGAVVIRDPWTSPQSSLPWITGVTSSEAAFFAVLLSSGSGTLLRMLDVLFDALAPRVLMYDSTSSEPEVVTNRLREFYLKNEKLTVDNIGTVVNMLSDAWFVYPWHEAMGRHNGTIYSYYFDHKGEENVVKSMGTEIELGVSHGEDVAYLFNNSKVRVYEGGSELDRTISKRMVELWTNFAIYGNPTPGLEGLNWRPWTRDGHETLHVGGATDAGGMDGGLLNVEHDPTVERINFWKTVPVRDDPKFQW